MTSDLRPFIKQWLVWVCCFLTKICQIHTQFVFNRFLWTSFYFKNMCFGIFGEFFFINCLPTSTLLKVCVRKQQQPVF